jgi:DNA-binding IscR family transcriptional regulator
MDKLKRKLTQELQQDFNVKILESISWSLPVHSIEIAFQTVMRTKMDILMKMMLIAFQKGKISTAEVLSELLLVEPLFIEDLIRKMTSAQMIEKNAGHFILTGTGMQQLESGIFIHEPENDMKNALYSPCHQSFLHGNPESLAAEVNEVYRHHAEFNDDWKVELIEKTDLLNALQSLGVDSAEGNVQIVISDIVSASAVQTDWVPCIEFRLYNEAEDLLFVRVWNTLSEQWDETLESQLNDKERKVWRENYLEKE